MYKQTKNCVLNKEIREKLLRFIQYYKFKI